MPCDEGSAPGTSSVTDSGPGASARRPQRLPISRSWTLRAANQRNVEASIECPSKRGKQVGKSFPAIPLAWNVGHAGCRTKRDATRGRRRVRGKSAGISDFNRHVK
jgi:hypothetical protein